MIYQHSLYIPMQQSMVLHYNRYYLSKPHDITLQQILPQQTTCYYNRCYPNKLCNITTNFSVLTGKSHELKLENHYLFCDYEENTKIFLLIIERQELSYWHAYHFIILCVLVVQWLA